MFSWPGLFKTWFIFSDWFLHVSFSRFQYSNLHFGSLLHCFINCLLLLGIHLQRTSALFFCYSFTKDHCPSLYFCYMFTKDAVLVNLFIYKGLLTVLISRFVYKGRSPCLLLFICKGPRSLCCGIHSQRTTVLVFAIHLQRTAVLVWCYLFAKDAVLVLGYSFAKDRGSLSYVIHLQRTAVLVLCH